MSAVRIVFVELHAWAWVGILLARVVVGLAFFLCGRGKLFVNERREQMRQALREAHIPFPEVNAVFVSTVEFLFGLLLVAGAATPLACVMLGGLMIVAVATTAVRTIKASSPLDWLSEFLYLPEGTLSRHPRVAFLFGARLVQRRSLDSIEDRRGD
jgi:uncharacterized membrane protein YphA (DoxX/SURF4 family)